MSFGEKKKKNDFKCAVRRIQSKVWKIVGRSKHFKIQPN